LVVMVMTMTVVAAVASVAGMGEVPLVFNCFCH